MTPIKIYGRLSSANVQKVLWLCTELPIPFQRIDAGGTFGFTTTPSFLQMNPNSKVPTIDEDGFYLWESHSIMRYLAATRAPGNPIYPTNPRERAHVEKYMDFLLASLGPPTTSVFLQLIRTPEPQRDLAAAEKSRLEAIPLVKVLDDLIGPDKDYLAGDILTLADIALGPFMHRWMNLPIERGEIKNVDRWYKAISEREGMKKFVLGPLS